MSADSKPKRDGDLFIVDNSDADWKVFQYLRENGEILKDASAIHHAIQCLPDTLRVCRQQPDSLVEIRKKLDKHLGRTYTRKVQGPRRSRPRPANLDGAELT